MEESVDTIVNDLEACQVLWHNGPEPSVSASTER